MTKPKDRYIRIARSLSASVKPEAVEAGASPGGEKLAHQRLSEPAAATSGDNADLAEVVLARFDRHEQILGLFELLEQSAPLRRVITDLPEQGEGVGFRLRWTAEPLRPMNMPTSSPPLIATVTCSVETSDELRLPRTPAPQRSVPSCQITRRSKDCPPLG